MTTLFDSLTKLCVAGLAFHLSACKNSSIVSQNTGSEILSEDTFDPVVVVLGGYWSCGSNTKSKNFAEWSPTDTSNAAGSISEIATKNLDTLKKEVGGNANLWFSCYTPEITVSEINFKSTFEPDKGVSRTSLEEMTNQLNAKLETLRRPKVAILGHSYGGWTAMKVAQNLTKKATLTSVITLDPISRVGCTPRKFIEAMEKKKFDTPCQESPKDFSPQDIETIAQRAGGSWHNFYQTEASYLHSSAIGSPLLKEDTEIKYNSKKDDLMSSHIRFLKDQSLNAKVTKIIVDGMKK